MGIEEQPFSIDNCQGIDSSQPIQKNQKRTDSETVKKTRKLPITSQKESMDSSLSTHHVTRQALPQSLLLFPRTSFDRNLAQDTCSKAADALKPGRYTLFADGINRCLMVLTKNRKFKYVPNVDGTFKGPVQNVQTGKWSQSKGNLRLEDVMVQFGGISDLLSLENLPQMSKEALNVAQNIQPGQFILLKTTDLSVVAVKKLGDGSLVQTHYTHDTLPGTFIEKDETGRNHRISLYKIVHAQGGIKNLGLDKLGIDKLAMTSSKVQEPSLQKVKDLPLWSSLTWDTLMGGFKPHEFVLFQDPKDGSIVVCKNKGQSLPLIDQATNKKYVAPKYESYSIRVVKQNGKEVYVDKAQKTYSSMDKLLTSLGGSQMLRYDKLYATLDEQRRNYELVED